MNVPVPQNSGMPEPITLDPSDWDAFAALAHEMLDEALAHTRGVGGRPAWKKMSEDVRVRLSSEELPKAGQGEREVFEQFVNDVQPFANGSTSPRHFGWVHGNGFPYAMMAEMLAAEMNAHLAGYDQAPAMVERKVVEWLREIMGFPESTSGLLLSGGSMANFTGLAVARNAQADFDIRKDGLVGAPKMIVYGTSETHSWAKKSVEVLGLGSRCYRQIDVDEEHRMDLDALTAAIQTDRAAERQPAVVIGTAGTVNIGATDDLDALANICAEEGLWFHVDGAFGALLAVTEKYRGIVKGMERADSVAFDLHKWMYFPFEIACLLVRDAGKHRATFSQSASYLATLERGVAAGGFPFADLGLELTRGFKALKAWMALKAYGLDRFGEIIERNVEQARILSRLVQESPELELLAPVPLNIVCFRFLKHGLSESELDAFNLEILLQIQEQGIAIPSSTVLGGRFAFRVCIVNHRTTERDLTELVAAVTRIGTNLLVG